MLVFLFGAFAASVVWFFVWRNNKKKFMGVMTRVDGVVSEYDTKEEIKARIKEIMN